MRPRIEASQWGLQQLLLWLTTNPNRSNKWQEENKFMRSLVALGSEGPHLAFRAGFAASALCWYLSLWLACFFLVTWGEVVYSRSKDPQLFVCILWVCREKIWLMTKQRKREKNSNTRLCCRRPRCHSNVWSSARLINGKSEKILSDSPCAFPPPCMY